MGELRSIGEIESFTKGLYDAFMGLSFDSRKMIENHYLMGYLEGKNSTQSENFVKPLVEGDL